MTPDIQPLQQIYGTSWNCTFGEKFQNFITGMMERNNGESSSANERQHNDVYRIILYDPVC